ncbi:MAG: type II secretion system F family protein [Candidatus Aenigmatarchaeota archaeon]
MKMISKYAFRLFGDFAKNLEPYFPELKEELKKADLKFSAQEYIANTLFVSFLSFLVCLPFLALSFSVASGNFLLAYTSSITVAIILPISVFFIYLNYPKSIIKDREKKIDQYLPFSTLYLSSILSSGIPLSKAFKIFVEFSTHESIVNEIKKIINDIEFFGLDIVTALERAIVRTPSRKFREFLYGMLATIRAGGNLHVFVKERSSEYMLDYKRKLSEFSHSMTIYTEIYLISIVLGTVFFVILTSVISAIGGATQSIIPMQIFMIFVFLPVISSLFLFLVKRATPAWD